jgi:hypothetical protein
MHLNQFTWFETGALLPDPTCQPLRASPLPHRSPTAVRLCHSCAAAGHRAPFSSAPSRTRPDPPSPFLLFLRSTEPPPPPPSLSIFPRLGKEAASTIPHRPSSSQAPHRPNCTEDLHHPLLLLLNSSRRPWSPQITGFQPKCRLR